MEYKYLGFIRNNLVVWLQLSLIFLLVTLVGAVTQSFNSILSAFMGGVSVLISTLVYGFVAFKDGIIVCPKVAFNNHQKAILGRFIANLILFILIFLLYRKCDFLSLFIAYIVVLSSYWLALVKFR